MKLKVYDTLSAEKKDFIPLDNRLVRMYVCGPTVYAVPHIGNIRASVVYDLVYRVLLNFFPKVSYVRNITDVDDKIIDAASRRGVPCEEVALHYEKVFHEHLALLNCLQPTIEPKATQNIGAMISMIQKLIDAGNAYCVHGNVYFDVGSFEKYGALSKRKREELVYGVRVEDDKKKKHPGDFVLWKRDDKIYWPSPWGNGRPGWHIECSAMTLATLGADFDIHGGGADLKFPHHENEIAQSICANPGSGFANYWIHNGFLTVNGEKMSKSLGNIINVDTLVNSGVTPNVIRFVLMTTHYRKPLDWNNLIVEEATNSLIKFKIALADSGFLSQSTSINPHSDDIDDNVVLHSHDTQKGTLSGVNDLQSQDSLKAVLSQIRTFDSDCEEYINAFFDCVSDDFNIPGAIAILHKLRAALYLTQQKRMDKLACLLHSLLMFLGIDLRVKQSRISEDFINSQMQKRAEYKRQRNFTAADKIRLALVRQGILLRDRRDTSTDWIAL